MTVVIESTVMMMLVMLAIITTIIINHHHHQHDHAGSMLLEMVPNAGHVKDGGDDQSDRGHGGGSKTDVQADDGDDPDANNKLDGD